MRGDVHHADGGAQLVDLLPRRDGAGIEEIVGNGRDLSEPQSRERGRRLRRMRLCITECDHEDTEANHESQALRLAFKRVLCASVIFVSFVVLYFRIESMLSFPDPTAAKYRKMKQYSTASSPPFWIGQNPRGACA